MSRVTIDLSNYKDRVGSRVREGRYRVVVDDAEQDRSAAGNEMINLWLRIVGGDFDGQTVVDRLVLTPNSLFRVVGFLQAIGIPTPKKRIQLDVSSFIGKRLDVDIADGDPYNGRVKSEVRGYLKVEQPQEPQRDLLDEIEGITAAKEADGVTDVEEVDLDQIDL